MLSTGECAYLSPFAGWVICMVDDQTLRDIATGRAGAEGALMPILVEINRQFGYVPTNATPILADVLNISQADVAGVISFYTDFRTTPPAKMIVKICRAEACQAAGGDALAAHAEAQLGCGFDETSADGAATLEAVYCFGNCALAPAFSVDGRLTGRGSAATLDAALQASS